MMTATDGAGLLDAILAAPDDDVPRLVCADWLDDNGQAERAEFVRLQIAREKDHPYFLCLPERSCKNCRRERALLDACGYGWCDGLFGEDWKVYGAVITFRRGFVESIRCPLAAWQQHGTAIVRKQPVTWVELTDRQPLEESGFFLWAWEDGESVRPHRLPDWLASSLYNCGPTATWTWASRQEALNALSGALLLWAKEVS